ncbi:DUF1850 domain-containing protein [Roseinatronobacter alkalisoli]|uniref:DUF1850 domain-containing protein n=1 Tax=Roseinatronobacter alkalisoli TaxID=3028235 RepID=A0ABT5TAB9_9RHOB|nr:DUF1850 domain-containing protein [Roseinatronobacter sp. HJB301]MDD7970878.1 DUF1850 domain-containing protein [Roseinatronobacter sp. HJB301]
MNALAIVTLVAGGPGAAHDCAQRAIDVVRLHDGVVLATLPARPFTLVWRNSVTLTMVQADYILGDGGQIIQIAERFAAHGPGMAHDGTGWRVENDQMAIELHRDVGRLILRSAPAHENRLIAGDTTIDLTQWPATPLEILSPDCKDTPR